MGKTKVSRWAYNCATEIDPNWCNRYAAIIDRHHKQHLAKQRKRRAAAESAAINRNLDWL